MSDRSRVRSRLAIGLLASLLAAPVQLLAQPPDSLSDLIVTGKDALRRGDATAAVAAFERATELAPDDGEVLLQLGTAYERAGSPAEAVVTFRQLLELDPSHRGARQALERLGVIGWSSAEILDRAHQALEQGRFKEAAYLYERWLRDEPDHRPAILGLARSHDGLGDVEQARLLYQRALELAPDLAESQSESAGELSEPARSSGELGPSRDSPAPTPAPAAGRDASSVEAPREAPSLPASLPRGPPAEPIQPAERTSSESTDTEQEQTREGKAAAPSEEIEQAKPGDASADFVAPSRSSDPASVEGRGEAAPDAPAAREPESKPRRAVFYLGVGGIGFALLASAGGALWLRRRAAKGRRYTLSGQLGQLPLPDVLQLIAMSRRIGVLEIDGGADGTGRLWLEGGRVVHAESTPPETEADQALHRVFSLVEGRFDFFEEPLPEGLEHDLEVSIESALLRWAKAIDDAGRDESEAPSTGLEDFADDVLNQDLPF